MFEAVEALVVVLVEELVEELIERLVEMLVGLCIIILTDIFRSVDFLLAQTASS